MAWSRIDPYTASMVLFKTAAHRAAEKSVSQVIIRAALSGMLHNCSGVIRDLLMARIHKTSRMREFILVRNDIYGYVAQTFGEAEAQTRLQLVWPYLGEALPRPESSP